MTAEIIVLRLIHVVGGIFWVGAMFLNSIFLFPSLAEAGPAAGPVMAGLQKRKLMSALPIAALLSILAGARLMWIVSGGFDGGWMRSNTGLALTIGAVAGIIAFLIGILVARPAAMRAGQIGAALAKAPEAEHAGLAAALAAANRRGAVAGRFVLVLLVVAACTMAVARYLG